MRQSLKTQEQDGALVCHPVQELIEQNVLTIRSYAAKRFDSADDRDEFVQDWSLQVLQDCPGTCSRQRFRSVSRSAIARVWESRSAERPELPELPDNCTSDNRRESMDVLRVYRPSSERMQELREFNEARSARIARAWEHMLNSLPFVHPRLFGAYWNDSKLRSDNVRSCYWKIAVLPTGSAWHTRERILSDSEVCPIRDSRKTRPSAVPLASGSADVQFLPGVDVFPFHPVLGSTEYQCYVTWLRLFAR